MATTRSGATGPATKTSYRGQVLTVEPYGIEYIAGEERHGSVRALFTLWFSANMGLPVWLVGALPILLGLGFADGVAVIVLGNVLGCAILAITASMGPAIGMPQLPFTRGSFGGRAVYLPALLNWVSASGWYAVNSILGALALARLALLPFGAALLVLTAGQMLLGIYGYNLIHRFEAASAIFLAGIFLLMLGVGLPQAHLGVVSRLAPADHLGISILVMTAVASYVFSWSPYAADYARYLPATTSKRRVFAAVFAGSFLGCVWLQVLGAAVATIGFHLAPIDLVVKVMGRFWLPALLAIVLGTITANALNIYTGALSLLTLDVPVRRWVSVVAVGVLGGALALYGVHGLASKYETFLLLLSYWIGPWWAVIVVDFFLRPGQGPQARPDSSPAAPRAVEWPGLAAFLAGLVASLPFMNSSLFTGPVARLLHGADLAYYIGMLVAGGLYYGLRKRETPSPMTLEPPQA